MSSVTSGLGISTEPVARKSRLDWVLYAIALGSLWYLDIEAQLHPSEIALGLLGLLLFLDRGRARPPAFLVVTLIVWFFGAIASDLIAGSAPVDAAKGALRVVLMLADFVGIWFLVRGRPDVAYRMWIAIAVGWFMAYLWWPSDLAQAVPWKFGLSVPVTLGIVLVLCRAPRNIVVVPGFLALTGLNFVLGFRSMAVVCGAAAILFLFRTASDRALSLGQAGVRLALVVVTSVIATAVLTTVYDRLAASGAFGVGEAGKVELQGSGVLGSILGGRAGVLPGLATIAENPIFGGGSYSAPSDASNTVIAQLYDAWGYAFVANNIQRGEAGFHSALIGAWAENGIAALPFWLCVIGVLGLGLLGVLSRRTRYAPLVAFVCLLGTWDVLFSPYGGDRRLWLAATLVLVLVCRERSPVAEKPWTAPR